MIGRLFQRIHVGSRCLDHRYGPARPSALATNTGLLKYPHAHNRP